MPTLIIPDVHERYDRLQQALSPERLSKASRVVFLGDWFDAFGKLRLDRLRQICAFLNRNISGIFYEPADAHEPGRLIPATFLLGNHDCHYFFRSRGFRCSGYHPLKQLTIDEALVPEVPGQFKIFTRVGPYLLSHAGFHPLWTLEMARPEIEEEALTRARRGEFHALFAAGRARGGDAPVGGATWLDWNFEFEHIPDTPQIVGHTHGEDIRMRGTDGPDGSTAEGHPSWCIDTGLQHILWIEDDGTVVTELVAQPTAAEA